MKNEALGIKTFKPYQVCYNIMTYEFVELVKAFILKEFGIKVELSIDIDVRRGETDRIAALNLLNEDELNGIDEFGDEDELSTAVETLAKIGLIASAPYDSMISMLDLLFGCNDDYTLYKSDDDKDEWDLLTFKINYDTFIQYEGFKSEIEPSYDTQVKETKAKLRKLFGLDEY